jgi:dihydroorotate dehydrogenase electron transfer subunit
MAYDIPAPVVRHQNLNPDHFLLTLAAPAIARAARPGQFVMLQVRDGLDPLLRRPMSLCRVLPGRRGLVQILYKVVGEGTRQLSRQPPGTMLRTLGPLGHGFALPRRATGPRGGRRRGSSRPTGPATTPVLIAGGIGIAIFPLLAEALLRRRLRPTLLFGGRTRRDLVGLDLFRRRSVPVRVATEDGSAGTRGFVTRLLEPLLQEAAAGRRRIELYVCGPTPMLRAVADLARPAGLSCQLALESHMPCGIGVCLGCVVRCRDEDGGAPFRRVCTEGPVFEAARVAP